MNDGKSYTKLADFVLSVPLNTNTQKSATIQEKNREGRLNRYAHPYWAVTTPVCIYDLITNWGRIPHSATDVLPQGIMAIQ